MTLLGDRRECAPVFTLYVDEAGEEGLNKLRSKDVNGSSEYFVMSGVLIRSARKEIFREDALRVLGPFVAPGRNMVHFKDVDNYRKSHLIEAVCGLKFLSFNVVSYKESIVGYRNLRCERSFARVVNGKTVPARYNWLYNSMFRYLMERVTSECRHLTNKHRISAGKIEIIFSRRKEFDYNQTRQYLNRLKYNVGASYSRNNARSIDFNYIDTGLVRSEKAIAEPALQVADVCASGIFASLDVAQLGNVDPRYILALKARMASRGGMVRNVGFSLFTGGLSPPLDSLQRVALSAMGYEFE